MKEFLSRSAKYRFYLLAAVLIFLGIFVMIDIISVRNNVIFDLSPTKVRTLSPQTKKILSSLRKDVRLTVFYEKGNRSKFADFLELCSKESPRFEYRLLDFDRYPIEAKKYGITVYDSAVIEYSDKKKVIHDLGEELLINGILKITRDTGKSILFLFGHGEHVFNEDKNGYSSVKRALEQENYNVELFSFNREEEIPADASLLIVGGPQEDLSEQETRGISNFIDNGGSVIFMIDPYTVPALVSFLKENYGIILGDDTIVDMKSQLVGGEYFIPIVPNFLKAHPITRDFTSAIVLPSARSIQLKEPPKEGVSAQPIAATSGESWAERDKKSLEEGKPSFDNKKDSPGPIPVMVIASVEGKKEAKIVVFGDSDFVNNSYLNVLGNKDFFLNTVSFLAGEENLISIRPKTKSKSSDNRLSLSKKQSELIFWLAVIIEPAFVLLIGVAIFFRRRIKG
jgi:ABC-type uncharacterized transport system involved in gliding motility auxiliary subunit